MKSTRKNITTNYVLESYRTDAISNRENRFTNVLISALLFVITVLLFSNSVSAQSVGLNNPNPHAKSLLDLTATDKGLLTPRMTEANRLAMFIAPDATAKGMLVYQTDNVQGFYVYDGTTWIFNGNEKTNWSTTGNKATNPTSNFIGTTDSVGLKFKTNNIDAINISANQKVTIGLPVPWSTLYVRGSDSAASAFTVRNLSYSGISGMTSISSGGTIVSQVGFVNATAPFHAGNFTVGTLANIPFTLITNNIERARLDANGNFGLDTIAPQARMHVKSNSSSVWPQILVEERDSADYSRISFMNKGTNKFWTVAATSAVADSNSRFNIFNSSTFDLLTVTGTGKVGLSHTNPRQRLEVNGNITLTSDVNNIRVNDIRVFSVAGTSNLFAGENAGLNNTSGNTNAYLGDSAGYSNTTGSANVAVGSNALKNNTGGNWNVAVGRSVLEANISGYSNSGLGISSLLKNTTGYRNTAIGGGSLQENTVGFENTSLGYYALNKNTTASRNVAIGSYALFNDTTGEKNTALGHSSGYSLTTGNNNLFLGVYSGINSTTSSNNVFAGAETGANNTTGGNNTFIGFQSGLSNTTASNNTMIGVQSGYSNNTGDWNTFLGSYTGLYNTTGQYNTFMGGDAGRNNTTAVANTFIGNGCGRQTTTGSYNVAIGADAGRTGTTAQRNAFLGVAAGGTITSGSWNTALGTDALRYNQTGDNNVMIGFEAGFNTTVSNNVMMGFRAGKATTTGTSNVFVGVNAGIVNTTGTNNVAIGNNAQVGAALTNATALGNNSSATTSNTMILGGTGADAVNVGIGTNAPQHKLSFGNDLGSKISFWQGGSTNYGIGVQGYLLQYYTAANSDDHVFGYGSSAAFTENMRIKGNGDVGIGTTTPTATLEVNGFTKLGTDAPAVKIKKYTGNTAATANGNINFAHGLNQAKILSVEVLVSSTSNTLYPPENSSSSGAYYHYFVTTTAVYIANDASNSANMLNRPYRVLITYEE